MKTEDSHVGRISRGHKDNEGSGDLSYEERLQELGLFSLSHLVLYQHCLPVWFLTWSCSGSWTRTELTQSAQHPEPTHPWLGRNLQRRLSETQTGFGHLQSIPGTMLENLSATKVDFRSFQWKETLLNAQWAKCRVFQKQGNEHVRLQGNIWLLTAVKQHYLLYW